MFYFLQDRQGRVGEQVYATHSIGYTYSPRCGVSSLRKLLTLLKLDGPRNNQRDRFPHYKVIHRLSTFTNLREILSNQLRIHRIKLRVDGPVEAYPPRIMYP